MASCLSLQVYLSFPGNKYGAEDDDSTIDWNPPPLSQSISLSPPEESADWLILLPTFRRPSECSEAAYQHLITLSKAGDTEMRVAVGHLAAYE